MTATFANTPPHKPSETTSVITEKIEGLTPEQGIARKLLVDHGLKSSEDAKHYVKLLTPHWIERLLLTLQKDGDKKSAFAEFDDELNPHLTALHMKQCAETRLADA